jgi:hypothetical protein
MPSRSARSTAAEVLDDGPQLRLGYARKVAALIKPAVEADHLVAGPLQ